jgi:hypothetical protein
MASKHAVSFYAPLEHELKMMAFPSSFHTLKMTPLRVSSPTGIYIIFGGIFHARKNLSLRPKQRKFALFSPCFGIEDCCSK